MTTELLDAPKSAVAAYLPFYSQLAELEQNNAMLAFDYESKKGNKEARSHINTLRLTKGALERTRKEAKAESLRIGRAVDSEASEIESRIEAMIAVHQVKIDEIEQREADRIGKITARLDELKIVHHGKSAADYRFHLTTLESVKIDESWAEFANTASIVKDEAIATHRQLLADREKSDAEAAELERLRAESAQRAQKDRDDAIAKAAADKAIADAKLQAEAEAAKARKAIEDAEAKAKHEREAAERRELELKLQAEQAERRRIESEQKAEQDKKDAADKALADQARAIKAEQDRVAAIAQAEADAQAKRAANQAHLAKINRAALAALVDGGISEECGKECIRLIAMGKIPNVQINY